MCRLLGVSRSGYYLWAKHETSERSQEDERLLSHIRQAYIRGRGTYGSPRITAELRDKGFSCGKNRIARLMRHNGIRAKTKRRFKVVTRYRHDVLVAQNCLKQNFSVKAANMLWFSDITFIWTREGWMYLAAILDAYDRQIVGWSISDRLSQEILNDALQKAVRKRRPEAGLIFHSDRGTQYTSHAFQGLLHQHGFVPSMCSTGNCYDNAVMESFFHTLKTELIYFEKYQSKREARGSVFEYIEVFYNRVRRHSALNYFPPAEFGERACEN